MRTLSLFEGVSWRTLMGYPSYERNRACALPSPSPFHYVMAKIVSVVQLAVHAKSSILYGRTAKIFRLEVLLLFCIIMLLRRSSTIIQITIDFFLIEQLRTASKMPILPCKPHVRLWVLSSEEYKEPEDAFKKISWDTVGFRNYFLNKVHRLFEKVRGSVASVKSRGVLNHPQSFVFSCSYFVFLKYFQRFFFYVS